MLVFRCQPNGFANAELRALTGELRGLDPGTVTTGQITWAAPRFPDCRFRVHLRGEL